MAELPKHQNERERVLEALARDPRARGVILDVRGSFLMKTATERPVDLICVLVYGDC